MRLNLGFLSFFNDKEDEEIKDELDHPVKSFAAPDNEDGATEVDAQYDPRYGRMSSVSSVQRDFNTHVKNTVQLISEYRNLAEIHEVDDAIQTIVDDSIVYESGKEVCWLDLDSTKFSKQVQEKIKDEFENVLRLFKFRKLGSKIFRHWYVDSRLHFHKILDEDTKEIIELRRLEPTQLEYVREIQKQNENGVEIFTGYLDYFIYRPSGYQNTSFNSREFRIPKDAIVSCYSGLTKKTSNGHTNVIGYLHRAIKPANQLKMLEDAMVIYRLTRAPERRVFYIDISGMQARRGQQYINNIMQGLKTRVVYDSATGKVKNTSSNMSMLEDYFLPRRDGGKGTEVSTLPAGQNLGDIDDVLYFNRKLYRAMRLPPSRAKEEDQSGGIYFGNDSNITRDELQFSKFIRRLRDKFSELFLDVLKHQLLVKNIITEEDWEENLEKLYIIYNNDSYFEEAKDLEIQGARLEALDRITPYVGKYVSNAYVMRNILRLTDDEIDDMSVEIDEESKNPRFKQQDVEEF